MLRLKLTEELSRGPNKDELRWNLRKKYGRVSMYWYDPKGTVQDGKGKVLYKGYTTQFTFGNDDSKTSIAITNIDDKDNDYIAFTFEELEVSSP